ncbi:hypothetical protein GCM10022237_16440 [Nocardioides ginsengisoli]|uniref:Biotin/lipoyl-containing protein n=1 Tax=Nocardioides ginsengisoli TaxID=363868 RepID=A0ABW3W4A6_9ACTN
MSTSVSITELGDGVEEAVLATWLCAVGDTVDAGQPIAEVMTDKVNLEIEAPVAGVVAALHGEPEDTVRIGQVIAEIGAPA